MGKIKRYAYIAIVGIMVVLATGLWKALKSKAYFEKRYKEATENVKSYSDLFDNSENKNRAFKLTIDQLRETNDSIFRKLDDARKELKVKDSKLRNMQYLSSEFAKTDIITLPGDTVFRDANVKVDTLLHDNWYSVGIKLQYPSTMVVSPSFKSEKYVVVSARKETVDPPKKFFLLRWFQKKHYVLSIDVVEKNPYVQNQRSRYVEIVR